MAIKQEALYKEKTCFFFPKPEKKNPISGKPEQANQKQQDTMKKLVISSGERVTAMENIPEYYKKTASKTFFVHNKQPKYRFFHGSRMEMDKKMGRGWSEMLCIHSGLYVEMADFCLKHRMETRGNMQPPLYLSILLSGHCEFQIPGRAKQRATLGDIWFIHAPLEQELRIKLPDENISTVSIGLPREEKLILGHSASKKNGQQAIPLLKGLQRSSAFMRMSRELLYTERRTYAANLRFESLALNLLSQILSLEAPDKDCLREKTGKVKAVVDEVVDILHREWNDPPTISTLARRVGSNECYLKQWFRQQTGMTIGEYIREQRMKKALEMIETGKYSITATAFFVGYSNPGHFSEAFKKFYGHLPSYYLPRATDKNTKAKVKRLC